MASQSQWLAAPSDRRSGQGRSSGRMGGQPTTRRAGLWTRVLAGLHGEVPAEYVEALRRVGTPVHDLIERANVLLQRPGILPWDAERSSQLVSALAWNAYVLQTLGEALMDADYGAKPETAGYLPPPTVDQVAALLHQVGDWLSRAQQASSNPHYRPDVLLPAELPDWREADLSRPIHVAGMMNALAIIGRRADSAVWRLDERSMPADRHWTLGLVRQRQAAAESAAQRAERLWTGPGRASVAGQVGKHAKKALDDYYLLGQMLAMPDLADFFQLRQAGGARPSRVRMLALPTEQGFDPWCLTDPLARPSLRQDPAAERQILDLWRADPSPRATLVIQAQIEIANDHGDIARASFHHYDRCPWGAIYRVMRPVVIGGRPLRQLQEFTYEVSAEGLARGGEFRREIQIGPFHPLERPPLRIVRSD